MNISVPADPTALAARLRMLEHVLARSGEAILITDHENRIVEINAEFTRLTGYSLDEVRGQNPRILASGKHSPEDYRTFWQSLMLNGIWQGEMWDRAKDGTLYPKWMTASVVRDEAGAIQNFVAHFADISETTEAAAKLAYMAHFDALTQLYNRAAIDSLLPQALSNAQRDGVQVAVMLIDLDRFKSVNDSLGHAVGDHLLKAVAQRLRDSMRASDIVARLGGDEFVVVLPDVENALSVTGVASKLKRNLADSYLVEGHTLYATPSIGITLFPGDGEDAATLLKNADQAMYHAKAQGRDNFQFFAEGMNVAASERMQLENGLRQAIEGARLGVQHEFRLYFQPQLHVASNRIVGLEALARWFHPEWGTIPPNKFIPVAEDTGLIQPLGDWVFWESCRHLRMFRDAGIDDIRVAVNLSAQQLRHSDLPFVVHGALACYDLKPTDLELEITESTAMQNPAATIAILEQLSDMGIVLSIDDFGTGYSSLSYLKHLPVNRLKLDRSFVQEIETSRDDHAICSATIALGHNLGLELVAEGVETEGQRDRLHLLGCDMLQGYLYSRPLPAEEVIPFLQQWRAEKGA
ncbi:MAG: EAL domain-containing protein [Rhodocyclaceae bacterium]|jgi:diguanylate cyclase (GGDEF)-like protein/PAS domain S-box-containing protein|nr:EAL domain-containing protein [Rhodocyclaceae bacterium]